MAYKYGRLAPHPEETHPRVRLRDHLTAEAPVPAVVDYASRVRQWPMYLNDRIGDCTCAGVGHMFQAWTAYATAEFDVSDVQVLSLYEVLSGYNPRTGANDNGANEQDVLQYLHDKGIAGHKILAFAQVDHASADEMKRALSLFGSVYLGILAPDSMQRQFADGEPIDVVPGAQIEGGHCIVIQKWDEEYLYVVTWGKLVKMTWRFFEQYGEEAWAIVTQDFIEKNGMSPSGLNVKGLLAAFQGIQAASPPPPMHAAGLLGRIVRWFRRVF
jgi:hypothetical protein